MPWRSTSKSFETFPPQSPLSAGNNLLRVASVFTVVATLDYQLCLDDFGKKAWDVVTPFIRCLRVIIIRPFPKLLRLIRVNFFILEVELIT